MFLVLPSHNSLGECCRWLLALSARVFRVFVFWCFGVFVFSCFRVLFVKCLTVESRKQRKQKHATSEPTHWEKHTKRNTASTNYSETHTRTVSVLRILCVLGAVHTEKPEMLCVNLNSKLPGVSVMRFASTCLMSCVPSRTRTGTRTREEKENRAAVFAIAAAAVCTHHITHNTHNTA